MEPTLQIYRAPSGEWAGVVCEEAEERARIAGCTSPHEVADTSREQWPSIRCTRHEQTPEKVVAALEGRIDAGQLSSDEQELFDELWSESLESPGPEEVAYFERLGKEVGAVGYDEQGRLVQRLPSGGMEVIEEADGSEW